jgi:arginine/ornithine N-succinyltransferase beta subunit
MNTYFLHFGHTDTSVKAGLTTLPEEREFLDDRIHKTAKVIDEIPADTWLEARFSLGNF